MNIGLINMEYAGGMKDYHQNFLRCIRDRVRKEILVEYIDSKAKTIMVSETSFDNFSTVKVSIPQFLKYYLFFYPELFDKKIFEFIENDDSIDMWIIVWDSFFLRRIPKALRNKLILVVHDVMMHDAKVNMLRWIARYVMHSRNVSKRRQLNFLLTNSKLQYYQLTELYPRKMILYLPMMPTITEEMVNGKEKLPEIEGIDSYFLFFGRIEYYKGIHLLVDAYKRSNIKIPLVIAGRGSIYFDIPDNKNIIIINRFIRQEEISTLFRQSRCVVFPYISATQVGPLSIAYYYGRPVITTSLLPFIENFDFQNPPGVIINPGDVYSLIWALEMFLDDQVVAEFSANSFRNYEKYYGNISKIVSSLFDDIKKI